MLSRETGLSQILYQCRKLKDWKKRMHIRTTNAIPSHKPCVQVVEHCTCLDIMKTVTASLFYI